MGRKSRGAREGRVTPTILTCACGKQTALNLPEGSRPRYTCRECCDRKVKTRKTLKPIRVDHHPWSTRTPSFPDSPGELPGYVRAENPHALDDGEPYQCLRERPLRGW
jgi:hypothetical protein